MADDLRERIQRGDLTALTDPTLPLHLLADGPTALWWLRGLRACGEALCVGLGLRLSSRPAEVQAAFKEWMVSTFEDAIVEAFAYEALFAGPKDGTLNAFHAYLQTAVRGRIIPPPDPPHLALVDLARRLRILLSEVPPEMDAALTELERYAQPSRPTERNPGHEDMAELPVALAAQEPFDGVAFRRDYQAVELRVIDQLQAATAADAPLKALARVEEDGLWKEIAGVGFLRFLSERGFNQQVIAAYDTYRDLRRLRANPKRREQMKHLEAMAVAALAH